VQRLWQSADTTLGSSPLYAVTATPVNIQPWVQVERFRFSPDTTQGSSRALLAAPVVTTTPFTVQPLASPERVRQVSDTSAGTPDTLTQNLAFPEFTQPQPQVERTRDVVNTTAGSPIGLLQPVVKLPAQNVYLGPIDRRQFTYQASQQTTPSIYTAPPVVIATAGKLIRDQENTVRLTQGNTSRPTVGSGTRTRR
jgi:hypothetical protein